MLKTRDEATPENISKLIDELESHRTFEVNGKRFLIIQCGENSILKTIKGEKYKSGFCLQDRDLKKKFNAIIDSVDVILNPSHNYWPRIYDLHPAQSQWQHVSQRPSSPREKFRSKMLSQPKTYSPDLQF